MPINFHWQFKTANVKGSRGSLINNPNIGDGEVIDLIKDMVDLPSNSYIIDNHESVLTYAPITEADYGYVYCWGENEISKQKEACRFEVSTNQDLIFYIVQTCFDKNIIFSSSNLCTEDTIFFVRL